MMLRRVFLLAVMLLLSGCGALEGCSILPGGGAITFNEIFEARREDEMQIVRSFELDVDGDTYDEWLVFYRYDPTQRAGWENTPIQAVVYDAIACDPPILATWRLPFPDNDYLGEGADIEVELEDRLVNGDDNTNPAEELLIYGAGPVNTFSIWRSTDPVRDACNPPSSPNDGFKLLGFFRANGEIDYNVQTDEVTTWQRTSFERSQLAIRSIYSPALLANGDQSFVDATGKTIRPREQTIDFLYGQPTSPTDSPYPEKAVASFYLSMGTDGNNDRAQSFVIPEDQGQYYQQEWGTSRTPDNLRRVLIYSISYNPDRAAELAREDRTIRVVIVPIVEGTGGEDVRLEAREVTLRVRGYPVPNQEECEWRILAIDNVVVTPGLGLLDTFDTDVGVALR